MYLFSIHRKITLARNTSEPKRLNALWIHVHLRLSPFLIICFLFLVEFVGNLCCFLRLLNPILSSNYLRRKSPVVAEEIHILSRKSFFQIPSQHFSRYNKLGVYRKSDCISFCLIELQSFFVEQAVYRPNTPYLGAFSTFACTMQNVVWSNQTPAIAVILIQGIHCCKEYCLSFLA